MDDADAFLQAAVGFFGKFFGCIGRVGIVVLGGGTACQCRSDNEFFFHVSSFKILVGHFVIGSVGKICCG
jgi:hypothetical protein